MKTFVSTIVCMLMLVAVAEKQPLSRYQSIIDRQMFGPLPPGFDPTKLPSEVAKSSASGKQLTQEQEKLQSAIHFSVINLTPDGATAVGFTDNSDPRAPVHYYLKVGERRNGWEVKAADPVAATMTIAKEDIEVSLSLGGNSAKKDGATAKAGATANRHGSSGGSLYERRMMRRKQEVEERARAEAAANAEREAREEREKAEREAERAEQRQQLLAIQEELKRVRDSKPAKENKDAEGENDDEDD